MPIAIALSNRLRNVCFFRGIPITIVMITTVVTKTIIIIIAKTKFPFGSSNYVALVKRGSNTINPISTLEVTKTASMIFMSSDTFGLFLFKLKFDKSPHFQTKVLPTCFLSTPQGHHTFCRESYHNNLQLASRSLISC